VSRIQPTPTVYSHYLPEVRRIVQGTLIEVNGDGDDSLHALLDGNIKPGLDDIHEPVMDSYERFARSQGVIALETFENRYYTNGSSEGIFHWLSQHRTFLGASVDEDPPLYQFEGEYQGYQEFAHTLRMKIIDVEASTRPGSLSGMKKGIFIISCPSAIDGNINSDLVSAVLDAGHKVVLDLAYMGMTDKPLNLDLRHSNILAVFGSLSKPFGLYYYRIGFTYTRHPLPSLYGNRWFKNALSLIIAEAVLNRLDHPALIERYKGLQSRAVLDANISFGLTGYEKKNQIAPSDVWLLGHLKRNDSYAPGDMTAFSRGRDNWRFCLTPYFKGY
jgi:hypothetical protein